MQASSLINKISELTEWYICFEQMTDKNVVWPQWEHSICINWYNSLMKVRITYYFQLYFIFEFTLKQI